MFNHTGNDLVCSDTNEDCNHSVANCVVGCSLGYKMESYPQFCDINSQIVEQSNALLKRIKGPLSYMTSANFMNHCRFYLWFTCRRKCGTKTSVIILFSFSIVQVFFPCHACLHHVSIKLYITVAWPWPETTAAIDCMRCVSFHRQNKWNFLMYMRDICRKCGISGIG